MASLLFKLKSTLSRIVFWLTTIPVLFKRLLAHLSYFIPFIAYRLPSKPRNFFLAIVELFMYLLDLLGVSAIYDALSEWLKWSTRPLNKTELEISKKYFGDTINYKIVRVHSNARFTANKLALAYVSFNTVNHYKAISIDVFIHEMMHVWQYQNLGGIYAIKALHAQYRGNAYDYGGFQGLYHAMLQGRDLLSFNFEQQAEIFQDYCKMRELNAMNPMAQSVYTYFTNQIYDF